MDTHVCSCSSLCKSEIWNLVNDVLIFFSFSFSFFSPLLLNRRYLQPSKFHNQSLHRSGSLLLREAQIGFCCQAQACLFCFLCFALLRFCYAVPGSLICIIKYASSVFSFLSKQSKLQNCGYLFYFFLTVIVPLCMYSCCYSMIIPYKTKWCKYIYVYK